MPFSAERLPVAPFDRVTEPSSVKILRESRSELLKPLLFIAEFCRRNKNKGLNMKVITMESSAFRSLTEQIAEIAAHVRAASGDKKAASSDRLLTTREAAHLLNVSTRTLQRMRSEQRIGYVVLRGKCRYRQSEIDRLLEACAVNEDAATPQELKRNHTLRTGGKPKGRRT
ncbi:DNA binding domain, excisionase family [Alloprevotella tannerae ATCC 51259]|uniref:DNA binding domain, excisionase family n=4 Tax=Bacteroidales TaxID=171549 RepID=C9LIH2_9BACT|nr:DNA binding domain, excisionase family [Alloprevotella tannerae ATCC 51259]